MSNSTDPDAYPVVDPAGYEDELVPSIPPRDARRQRGWVIGGVLFTLVLLGFVVWAGVGNAKDDVSWRDLGYHVDSPSQVTARWELTKPKDRSVTCLVRALDKGYGVVGSKEVQVPAGRELVDTTTVLRTTSLAVTGTVRSCILDPR